MAQHFQGQPPFPHIRHHTPSASPPIPNGVIFQGGQRVHTPQPQMGSRPGSRNDMRRMGPNMVPQPVGPYGPPQGPPVNGYAYVPHPAIYNPQNQQNMPPGPQYPHPPPPPPPPPHMQMHMDNQRQSSVPPSFPPHHPPQQHTPPLPARHSLSPPTQQRHGLPSAPAARRASPQPRPGLQPPSQEGPPPGIKTEPMERPAPAAPLLDTALAIKKLPQRKQHSIFTPIDENRSVLSQHLAAFAESGMKNELANGNRSSSLDPSRNTATPPQPPKRPESGPSGQRRQLSTSSIPEVPSRSNSLRVGGASRPRLKVQIPDEPSEAGSNTADSTSGGQPSTDATSQTTRQGDSHSSGLVLPPPSPSNATTLLSAGATGPPNPFARPAPSTSNNNPSHNLIDTPASALPSRYMNNEFLPSPSQFFPDLYARNHDSNNTLPSPLNFATPVVGSGPSFLREEASALKRKSPESNASGPPPDPIEPSNEPKRVKVGN